MPQTKGLSRSIPDQRQISARERRQQYAEQRHHTSHNKHHILPVYKDLYTLSMFAYEYSGGAHGNYGTQLYQFTQAGNRLSWKDILLPDAEKAIQPLLQKAIAQHLEIPTTTPVAEMGLFIQNNTIPLAYSFALTEKGLRLIYNPYEIASYAVGMIDITIPYAALSNVVKTEYY